MICSVFHFLGGYCKIALSGGGQERFLNICVSRQILIWKLRRKEGRYIFYVSKKGMEELEAITQKTGCRYEVITKKGLPFLFFRYRKRKILLGACLLSAMALYILSLFLWQIEAVGCYSHSSEEMMDYLASQGIREGRLLSRISCEELEEQIRRDFKDIAWASCDLRGTLLTVSVKETLDKEALKEALEGGEGKNPCSLVAPKKGLIDSIVVRSGSGMVKKGDTVKRGDLLISGEVALYDDGGELTETMLVRASGEIRAITRLKYKDSFPMVAYEKTYTGRKKERWSLLVGKDSYPLPGQEVPFQNYDEISRRKKLRIGSNLYLPLSLVVTTALECEVKPQRYTKQGAVEEARRRLKVWMKEYEEKGVEILKNNVTIDCDENRCSARGKVTVRETFGKIREIKKEEISGIESAGVLEE
ncbi:MAG: sporulation protein YqfD [Eubacteriales bacterium]|nr:sporulation protein YqfD [Eubacteriales bacterium]